MGGRPMSETTPLTRMLVDVPISVQQPPKMDAKLNGMSSRVGATPMAVDSWMTTGMKTATMGVLLMKALITATVSSMLTMPSEGCARNRPVTRCTSTCRAPVFSSAAESTNMKATVSVAGLEKPATASAGVTRPSRARVAISSRATRSMLSHSVANSTMAAPMSTSTSQASGVMAGVMGRWRKGKGACRAKARGRLPRKDTEEAPRRCRFYPVNPS